ncbi:MAG TPA: GAF domain-containing protein [Candidatus Polarisedimenticolaceae bacterium]|nr:GAF domain-containing protein [Candidatus Polarisedimenticolaceae bacterium]
MKAPIALETLTPCFQGIIPSFFYTCSKAGVPNCAVISHVEYVDPKHVALSHQFFNKSKRNISENPSAMIRVVDPDDGQCYELRVRYVRAETTGPVFQSMNLRIEAIAAHSGLKGIFKLLAADIYEVVSVVKALDEVGIPRVNDRRAQGVLFTMKALQEFTDRIHRATCLEGLLDSILEALESLFGFSHSMILLVDDKPGRLVTIASRGYPEAGVGAEVGVGDGIIGLVAEARKPIRISGLIRQMLYAYAVMTRAQQQGLCSEKRRIPLPGLAHPESQLGIPLTARGELAGVLCIESEKPYRFHEEDKIYLEVLGGYLAIAIQNMLLHQRAEDDVESAAAPQAAAPTSPTNGKKREIAYYAADEVIMADGEYLVRSLPARLLWKFLTERQRDGRTEFTNRELRLDKSLALPAYKDNLESRLILLRKRLKERCPEIRIVPSARGRFVVDVGCELRLEER